ncbi:MAG: histidine kinase [Ruminococcus sp.]|jgi:two-component system sensor histidine kinase YesM|nr:histidine kinase [Ruminococcus sp.]
MKSKVSIRLPIRFLAVALIPILIFFTVTQIYMARTEKQYMDERINSNLSMSNQVLDMVLEKYAEILYDLCTDPDILDMVESINAAGDVLDENISRLGHELGNICNRHEGIEGIMISLEDGRNIFYDGLSSSSVSSSWIEELGTPEVDNGDVYRGISDPVMNKEQKVYIFQIARNLTDSSSDDKNRAVAAININEEQICSALNSGGDRQSYLLDGSTILSASVKEDIGQNYGELMDEKKNQYTCSPSTMSGFTICNIQSMKSYNHSMRIQYISLGIFALLSMFMILVLTFSAVKPYLKLVDSYVDAMIRVGKGDFSVRALQQKWMDPQMRRVENEFNDMVVQIESQVEEGKRASLKQKYAEMSALEAQITPHFLYNTLDMINWKAIEDEQYEISEMLGLLGDILRYISKNTGGMTTLRTEFEWLDHYIRLQNVELDRRTKLELEVPEEMMEVEIHKLLLQPFIENAFKYAFLKKKNDHVIIVGAGLSGSQLHITIEDNGEGIEESLLRKLNDEASDMGEHVGIANVRKRLKLYYGEEAVVYFESIPDDYTRIHLLIPQWTKANSS